MPLTVICDGCGKDLPTVIGLIPDTEGDMRPVLCPKNGTYRFHVTESGDFLFACDEPCMFMARGAADAALLPKEKKDDA